MVKKMPKKIKEVEFVGAVWRNGRLVTVKGTLEELVAQIPTGES